MSNNEFLFSIDTIPFGNKKIDKKINEIVDKIINSILENMVQERKNYLSNIGIIFKEYKSLLEKIKLVKILYLLEKDEDDEVLYNIFNKEDLELKTGSRTNCIEIEEIIKKYNHNNLNIYKTIKKYRIKNMWLYKKFSYNIEDEEIFKIIEEEKDKSPIEKTYINNFKELYNILEYIKNKGIETNIKFFNKVLGKLSDFITYKSKEYEKNIADLTEKEKIDYFQIKKIEEEELLKYIKKIFFHDAFKNIIPNHNTFYIILKYIKDGKININNFKNLFEIIGIYSSEYENLIYINYTMSLSEIKKELIKIYKS